MEVLDPDLLVPALCRGKQALARLLGELGQEGMAVLLQQHRLVPNKGDGSCFLHVLLHAVGAMSLETRAPAAPRGTTAIWRLTLCDMAMRFVTCGKFVSLAEYDNLPRAAKDELQTFEGALAPAQVQLIQERSLYLDVDSLEPSASTGGHGTRSSARSSLFSRVAAAVRVYKNDQRHIPCSWWA